MGFGVPMGCKGSPYAIWVPHRIVGVPDAGVGFLGSP